MAQNWIELKTSSLFVKALSFTLVKNPKFSRGGGLGKVILANSKRGSGYPQMSSSGVL